MRAVELVRVPVATDAERLSPRLADMVFSGTWLIRDGSLRPAQATNAQFLFLLPIWNELTQVLNPTEAFTPGDRVRRREHAARGRRGLGAKVR